jgi:hypothetical protein
MAKRLRTIVLVILVTLLAGCGVMAAQREADFVSAPEPLMEQYTSASGANLVGAPSAEQKSFGTIGPSGQPMAQDRLVIRTATLTMVVMDPAASVREISLLAEEMGGYVVNSYVYQTVFGEAQIVADQGSISIRVPSRRFEEALERIKGTAVEVRNENKQGEDITQQYIDLESRVRNLEAAEAELREIMASAVKTEDVLAVYAQLVQIRGEIETNKGQMQYFEQSSAFASISIELVPDVADQPADFGKWLPLVTARESLESLVRSLQFLADVAIRFLIAVLPVLVIIGLPIWLVLRAIVRRRSRRASVAEVKPS